MGVEWPRPPGKCARSANARPCNRSAEEAHHQPTTWQHWERRPLATTSLTQEPRDLWSSAAKTVANRVPRRHNTTNSTISETLTELPRAMTAKKTMAKCQFETGRKATSSVSARKQQHRNTLKSPYPTFEGRPKALRARSTRGTQLGRGHRTLHGITGSN